MRETPLILIVDDQADNREILRMRLESQGFDTALASDGPEAVAQARALVPDLMLLDVMMPGMDGFEVCRTLRADPGMPFVPIILVTAKATVESVVAGLDAGADDYLPKPVDHSALVARVRSMMRIKRQHDTISRQRAELADWNARLEEKVAAQVEEIERVGRLKRFLPPQVAEIIVTEGREAMLQSHRADITVLFADLRGFTAFANRVAPDTVMGALNAYHALAGALIDRYEGTLERFAGDGLMIYFNDPVPCPDPVNRAARLAQELHAGITRQIAPFTSGEAPLGLGVGIAQGEATLGQIGFETRSDYAAIGAVSNLAARLCDAAQAGETLIAADAAAALNGALATTPQGRHSFKGFSEEIDVVALG